MLHVNLLLQYSGALLIRSPMGKKKLATLTGDRINEGFFLQEWPFCQAAKKVAVITR